MEEKIKEYMEHIWEHQSCRSPLQLCKWYAVKDEQGYFYFLGLRRGHDDAED